jgi:hypothetical protein
MNVKKRRNVRNNENSDSVEDADSDADSKGFMKRCLDANIRG